MSHFPLVSIITPTYNHENYIVDCIRSAQSQTFTDWEMIIVDDGSTDNTFSLAKTCSKEDSRIKVFPQKNVGIFRLGETYNFAVSKATGKYIAVLEGDDVWLPEKLNLQVSAMEADNDIVLCYGNAYSSKSDLSSNYGLTDLASKQPIDVRENNPIGSATKILIFSNFIVALTALIRRETLTTIGGFKQSHGLPLVDLTTWTELSLLGKFSFIPEPLGKWRFYPNQITKTYTAEISEGFYKFTLDFYDKNLNTFDTLDITKRNITVHFRKQLVEAHSRSGRYKLMRKDFSGARKNYLKSIFGYGFYGLMWRLRSIVGFGFSIFHMDIENFAKCLGKVSYK